MQLPCILALENVLASSALVLICQVRLGRRRKAYLIRLAATQRAARNQLVHGLPFFSANVWHVRHCGPALVKAQRRRFQIARASRSVLIVSMSR